MLVWISFWGRISLITKSSYFILLDLVVSPISYPNLLSKTTKVKQFANFFQLNKRLTLPFFLQTETAERALKISFALLRKVPPESLQHLQESNLANIREMLGEFVKSSCCVQVSSVYAVCSCP